MKPESLKHDMFSVQLVPLKGHGSVLTLGMCRSSIPVFVKYRCTVLYVGNRNSKMSHLWGNV